MLTTLINYGFNRTLGNAEETSYLDLVPFAFLLVLVFLKVKAQVAANVASDDPDGRGNSRFTVGNILWLIPGAFFWLLIAIGSLLTIVGDTSQ